MPRRKDPTQPAGLAGRKPKNPMDRIGWPVRALVTHRVIEALQQSMALHDLPASDPRTRVSSDVVRLGLYMLLKKDGLIESVPGLEADPSWDELKRKGLV